MLSFALPLISCNKLIHNYFRSALLYFIVVQQLFAKIPAGYYSNAEGKSGAELKTALYNIIKNHNVQSYTPGVWNAFQTTDLKPNGKIWDIYSDIPTGIPAYEYVLVTNQCGNYNSESDCYNREHSFPKSWFNVDNPSTSSPPSVDIFHLYPTDGFVNGKRSNYTYGEVANPTFTSSNGSRLGTNTFPGYSGIAFEPINEYKGDLARTYFYMATRYENLIAGWEHYDNDGDAVMNGTAFPAYESWFSELLKKWHTQDPVSQKEIDRNNAIYAIQNNRNPYIDHPEYAGLVWGFGTLSGTNTTAGSNLAPLAENFTLTGFANSTLSGSLTGKYSDPNADVLTINSVFNTSTSGNGKMQIASSGNIKYIPAANFYGVDFYQYQVCDPLTCTSGIIYFDVKYVNKAPIAKSDTFIVAKNLAFSGSINDLYSDLNNDVLTLQSFIGTLAGGSNFLLNANGSFTFIPKPSFVGLETYTYKVCDQDSCSFGKLNFSIAGITNSMEKFADNFKLYPQPVSDILIISSNKTIIKSIALYNLLGEKIDVQAVDNSPSVAIDVSHLNAGSYFLMIESERLTFAKQVLIVK